MEEKNGKYIFGVCKVGEKGQIVISKEARQIFNINPGDSLLLMGGGGKKTFSQKVFFPPKKTLATAPFLK